MDLPTISLATGIGALDLGVQLAGRVLGWTPRTICLVERESFAAANLAIKGEAAGVAVPIWSDITTFAGVAKCFRHKVGILTAGLPCQPFSVAGLQQGEDDERYLWPAFFDILEACRPPLVFVENVPNILQFWEPIGERLCGMGYEFEAGIYSSAEVGGSHLRKRFFALGYRDRGRLSIERWQKRSDNRQHPPWNNVDGYGPPPLPGDVAGWARVRATRPDLAPALANSPRHGECGQNREDGWRLGTASTSESSSGIASTQSAILRVVDEPADLTQRCLANRIDRIRAVGNSCDPVTVAVAFLHLSARLGLWDGISDTTEEN